MEVKAVVGEIYMVNRGSFKKPQYQCPTAVIKEILFAFSSTTKARRCVNKYQSVREMGAARRKLRPISVERGRTCKVV